MRIEELGPADADHSTGLILHWRGRLLFALLPVHQWRETAEGTLAHFVGIGGHLESGEGWVEAVQREVREEAGVPVDLASPGETWFLSEDGAVQDISALLEWPHTPRPWFIWSAAFRLGQPPDERARHFVNAVFQATLPDDVEPRPCAEMPAILAITKTQLHQTALHPVALHDLLACGAAIWESLPIPRATLTAPQGTAHWYEVWLRRRASTAGTCPREEKPCPPC
jgi:8-oxo-dGTP pyrophosphatase MutT (NUDIX family)